MKFDIVTRQFKDKNIEGVIIKMFEFFVHLNSEKAEKIKKSKNRQDLFDLLSELANYIETGLKKKLSENFVVLISENPSYALKYEKHYLLGLKYGNYEILVTKSPFICIPGRFSKNLNEEENDLIKKHYEERKESLKLENIKTINYYNKYFHTISTKNLEKLKYYDECFLVDSIIKNISYYAITAAKEKDTSKLALGIQNDICREDKDYNWCVIVSKQQIYTNDLITNSEIFFHCRIVDDNKKLNISGLRETEILIFKKSAVFESILKNILTGKLYEIEFKHLVILVSVVIFLIMMTVCKSDYSSVDVKNLGWFENKVCTNKNSIISSIALMFIIAVVSGMIRKRMKRKK